MMEAQLTLFYSGRVYVYENVPPEKANAIMLLLANGGSGGDHDIKPSLADERKNATAGGSSRSSPPSSSSPYISTSFMVSSQAQLMKQPHHLVIQRSQAELPVARKASLARFLEKRADNRTQAKLPTVVGLPCTSTAQENPYLSTMMPTSQ